MKQQQQIVQRPDKTNKKQTIAAAQAQSAPGPNHEQISQLQEMMNTSPRHGHVQALQKKISHSGIGSSYAVAQAKIDHIETPNGLQWFDNENVELGFFPTREKLVEVMRANYADKEVPVFDMRGESIEKLNELYGTKIFHRKRGPFTYQIVQSNADGQNRIEVYAPDETEPVGYANFTIETWQNLGVPNANEYYTKAHVLGLVPKVAHLTGIYNTSMTRNGPADIYNGFGNALLQRVEQLAHAHGAEIMYLEPAKADVRKEPNTNEKERQDPTGFFTKHGYGLDAASLPHNWAKAMSEIGGLGLSPQDSAKYAQNQVKGKLAGMLSKDI